MQYTDIMFSLRNPKFLSILCAPQLLSGSKGRRPMTVCFCWHFMYIVIFIEFISPLCCRQFMLSSFFIFQLRFLLKVWLAFILGVWPFFRRRRGFVPLRFPRLKSVPSKETAMTATTIETPKPILVSLLSVVAAGVGVGFEAGKGGAVEFVLEEFDGDAVIEINEPDTDERVTSGVTFSPPPEQAVNPRSSPGFQMPAGPRPEHGVGRTTGAPEGATQIPLDKYSLVMEYAVKTMKEPVELGLLPFSSGKNVAVSVHNTNPVPSELSSKSLV